MDGEGSRMKEYLNVQEETARYRIRLAGFERVRSIEEYMSLCRLCHCDHQLRNSHIVPKSLYKELKNSKGHAMVITGLGNRGWKPLQDGAKEFLFCSNASNILTNIMKNHF